MKTRKNWRAVAWQHRTMDDPILLPHRTHQDSLTRLGVRTNRWTNWKRTWLVVTQHVILKSLNMFAEALGEISKFLQTTTTLEKEKPRKIRTRRNQKRSFSLTFGMDECMEGGALIPLHSLKTKQAVGPDHRRKTELSVRTLKRRQRGRTQLPRLKKKEQDKMPTRPVGSYWHFNDVIRKQTPLQDFAQIYCFVPNFHDWWNPVKRNNILLKALMQEEVTKRPTAYLKARQSSSHSFQSEIRGLAFSAERRARRL